MVKIQFNKGNTYTKGGAVMEIVNLQDIVVKDAAKSDLPWLQLFNTGRRVTSDNIDWSAWNGCVYSDIDSKHYYKECKQFDPNKLKNALHEYLLINFNLNYYGMQASNSGTSYHILFFFDVERTEDNFKKCAQKVKEIVAEAFTNIGAKDIFEWPKVADRCSSSPYQGMYLTAKPWLWGNYNQPGFGSFEDIETYKLEKKGIVKVSDVQPDGTELFMLKSYKPTDKPIEYKDHHQRWAIYDALIAVFKDKAKVDEEWAMIANRLPEENKHTHGFYMDEPRKNRWYERYSPGQYVKVGVLQQFGYNIQKKFIPQDIDLYKPDLVYELEENQHLSDIDIEWDTKRCNHVFAGCGFGKTFMAKEFSNSGKRVCFISPMTSINKDSFDKEDAKYWMIVDEFHKEEISYVAGDVLNILGRRKNPIDIPGYFIDDGSEAPKPRWSVCTTWESFWLYEMWKDDFDYYVFDEIHTLYMYDYRLESIGHIKSIIKGLPGITILMTGTPSYEVEEFDCKKILVNKKMTRVKADILFYNKFSKGYIYSDIRKWIAESPNNYALIFQDQTNYMIEDDLKFYGFDCDIFNKQYTETVGYVINNQTLRKQVTAFSVYGQVGINLYFDIDKRVRIYIRNINALGIIQYANRVRNKDVIDRIVIPYKNSKINNDIVPLNTTINYEDARKKIDMINTNRFKYDLFDKRVKKMFEVMYGLSTDVLDCYDEKFWLNDKKYAAYCMIKNVQKYESQMQLIYNRLTTNYFDVNYIYRNSDVASGKHGQLRADRFGGQMARFDWTMVQETRDGKLWIKPTADFNKVVTGNLKEVLEDIINRLYKDNKYDKEKTESDFKSIIQKIVRRKGAISKVDIVNYDKFMELLASFNEYIDNEFLERMANYDWDLVKEAARYTRSLYNNQIDWKAAAVEVIDNLGELSEIVSDNIEHFWVKEEVKKKMDIPNDDITKEIEDYLTSYLTRKKKKGSAVVVDGIRYTSIADAIEKTGLSRTTIWRKVKRAAEVKAGSDKRGA